LVFFFLLSSLVILWEIKCLGLCWSWVFFLCFFNFLSFFYHFSWGNLTAFSSFLLTSVVHGCFNWYWVVLGWCFIGLLFWLLLWYLSWGLIVGCRRHLVVRIKWLSLHLIIRIVLILLIVLHLHLLLLLLLIIFIVLIIFLD